MKKIIRSVLSGFCFTVFGLGGIIAGTLIVPIPLLLLDKNGQRRMLSGTVHYLWRAFIWLMCTLRLIDVKIQGAEKLKEMRGKIVIANHPSLIDVVILVSRIPRSICVVKGSLFQNIFVKYVIRHVYLSNSMEPEKFIHQASSVLNDGYNIIIFPEGTRTIPGKPIHLHRGFAYLHLESKHAIQPVHIKNNPYILGKLHKWYAVGDKTSVYTLKVLPQIKSEKIENNRQNAILITKKAEKALFS